MKLAVGISVCGWVPERVARAEKLRDELGGLGVIVSKSETKEHASVWWPRLVKRLLEVQDADAYVFLNDDIELAPHLLESVEWALEVSGQGILSLHTSAPGAEQVQGSFCRCYWLTGPGYVIRRDWLLEYMRWYEALPEKLRGFGNEDDKLTVYCYMRRQPIWQTIPALVKHDTSFATVIEEHRNHEFRTTNVPWKDREGRIPKHDGIPPLLENPYKPWPFLQQLEMAFRGIDARAQPVPKEKPPHLFISVLGWNVSPYHALARERLILDLASMGWDITMHPDQTTGVDRARNICAAKFLESGADAWLQIDSDLYFRTEDVVAMFGFVRDGQGEVVGGAYPKKDVNYEQIAKAVREGVPDSELHKHASDFVVGGPVGETLLNKDTGHRFAEVALLGTGFLMVSRKALLAYAKEYRQEIRYIANYPPYVGQVHDAFFMCELNVNARRPMASRKLLDAAGRGAPPTVLMMLAAEYKAACEASDEELPNYQTEDWSFCDRWRLMGGKCWLFVDCKLVHQGPHLFDAEISPAWFPLPVERVDEAAGARAGSTPVETAGQHA